MKNVVQVLRLIEEKSGSNRVVRIIIGNQISEAQLEDGTIIIIEGGSNNETY